MCPSGEIETVQSLVTERRVGPTQDFLVELAVDELAPQVREAAGRPMHSIVQRDGLKAMLAWRDRRYGERLAESDPREPT